VLIGAVDVTAPTLHELMRREIPVSWYSGGGWFLGHTTGTGHRNVELRTAQYRASFDPMFCLRLARGPVASKLRNSRTLLRRNWRGETSPDAVLGGLQRSARAAAEARRAEVCARRDYRPRARPCGDLDLGPAAGIRPRVESLGKPFTAVERGPVIV